MQTHLLERVPFIDDVDLHTCDQHGKTLSKNDISVTIPPGAIPDGVTAHIEMGVALYGPFKFSDNHQAVSPFLWFCIQEDFKLLLPITYKLPHVIIDSSRRTLAFAKADHFKSYDSTSKRTLLFEFLTDGESNFTKESGFGYLTTKHSCFLCIKAQTSRDLALEKGYCLHTLIEKIDSSSYRIFLLTTYFLSTCSEVSHFTTVVCMCRSRYITFPLHI